MNYMPIIPGAPESSRLIFGCSGLAGRVSRSASIRAIDLALGAGINHFDIARSYGYGDAETCLGDALKSSRTKAVITGKFGIQPSPRGRGLVFLKPLAQILVSSIPPIRPFLRKALQGSGVKATGGHFELNESAKSIETSLRSLQTDYLDLLLMHDCRLEDVNDNMVNFLEDLIKTGRIKAYGAATTPETAKVIETRYPGKFIFQLPDNLISKNTDPWRPTVPFITYGLMHNIDRISKTITQRAYELRSLNLSHLSKQDIFEIMLQYGIFENPKGSIVCSMLSPDHLRINISVLKKPRFSVEQVKGFASLINRTVSIG